MRVEYYKGVGRYVLFYASGISTVFKFESLKYFRFIIFLHLSQSFIQITIRKTIYFLSRHFVAFQNLVLCNIWHSISKLFAFSFSLELIKKYIEQCFTYQKRTRVYVKYLVQLQIDCCHHWIHCLCVLVTQMNTDIQLQKHSIFSSIRHRDLLIL